MNYAHYPGSSEDLSASMLGLHIYITEISFYIVSEFQTEVLMLAHAYLLSHLPSPSYTVLYEIKEVTSCEDSVHYLAILNSFSVKDSANFYPK